MKIEIWSDVVCPFCYIGKRHLEKALSNFEHKNEVEIIWKSYLLNPNQHLEPETDLNVYQYLAQKKGISVDESIAMHENVVSMAQKAGLTYNFDQAKVSSSLDAHRLLQFAKEKGLGGELKEALFKGYFTNGLNLSNQEELVKIAEGIGLNPMEAKAAFSDDRHLQKVQSDLEEAQQIGVRGVPFFVLNRRYAVSGAQPAEFILETIQKAYVETIAQ